MRKDKVNDRRILRTRTAIREALVSLILEMGFDAVTVSDIAERANINRGTFYLHYNDKYDLLDQTELEIIDDIENIIIQANMINYSDFKDFDNPLPVTIAVFEYLKANADLMHAILELEGDFKFFSRLRKTVMKNLKLGFLTGIKTENFIVPVDYLISYVISANFGVIQTWLKNGCHETPKQMAIILSKISILGPLQMTGVSIPKFEHK